MYIYIYIYIYTYYIHIYICMYIYIYISKWHMKNSPRLPRPALFQPPTKVQSVSPALLRFALDVSQCDSHIAPDRITSGQQPGHPRLGPAFAGITRPLTYIREGSFFWSPQKSIPKRGYVLACHAGSPNLGGHLHGRSALRVGRVGKETAMNAILAQLHLSQNESIHWLT